jgi:DNA adenine methylase
MRASENLELQQSNQLQDYSQQVDLCHCYPFVKWAGGKSQILSELDFMVPSQFNRYFEPFLGGGAMFFHISLKNIQFTSYLSDINEDLINAYRVVKDNVDELIRLLLHHEAEYNNSRHEFYYQLRANIKPVTDVERAARFITLNKTCYNGLYRVNSKGIFNVPMGRYKNPMICDCRNLRKVGTALRDSNAKIQAIDYTDALLRAEEGDFIYLDPPYDPLSGTAYFTHYTHNGFTEQDQRKLAKVFATLNERKCKILLSNSDTQLVRNLYKDFAKYTKELIVLRSINSKASRRMGHKELLIRNYDYNTCL